MKLTGRYYFRKTWLGLVLYVEFEEHNGGRILHWKKAREQDVLELGLNYIDKK
jgi:hypothetical protein